MAEFRALCEQFIAATDKEPGCLYYGFSFHDDEVYCREGYVGAEGLLSHLSNVGAILDAALKISVLTRLEIHGVEEELAKLREQLAHLGATYFTLEYGFRK